MSESAAQTDRAEYERKLQRVYGDIHSASWFSAVGEPLTEGERSDALHYIHRLGFSQAGVEGVDSWQRARAITSDPSWDPLWWQAEDKARKALYQQALAAMEEMELLRLLTGVTEAAMEELHGYAAVSAARAGVADQSLSRVAAGAAAQACYQAALAVINGADENQDPFLAKLRLFAAGRWPLCVIDSRLYVF